MTFFTSTSSFHDAEKSDVMALESLELFRLPAIVVYVWVQQNNSGGGLQR